MLRTPEAVQPTPAARCWTVCPAIVAGPPRRRVVQAAPVIKSIPAPSYAALPFVLAPLLSNPVTMAANRAIGATSPFDVVQRIGTGMLDMLPGLGKLAEILPQDTLVWKLGLLAEGCAYLDTRYHLVRPRMLCSAVYAPVDTPSGIT